MPWSRTEPTTCALTACSGAPANVETCGNRGETAAPQRCSLKLPRSIRTIWALCRYREGRDDDRLTGRGRLLPYTAPAAAGSTSPARRIRCWPLRATVHLSWPEWAQRRRLRRAYGDHEPDRSPSRVRVLDELLTDVLAGASSAIVLRGEAGVGKSAVRRPERRTSHPGSPTHSQTAMSTSEEACACTQSSAAMDGRCC
jgi:hypothetical protein